jgi:putative SOS response-associated peptidase YedK
MSVEFEGLMEEFPWLSWPDDLPRRYNIAPTQPVAVVPNDGRKTVQMFIWGLVPSWAKDSSIGSRMINARAETVAEKPSFRVAFRRRRCLIPASGWFEWGKPEEKGGRKIPYFIRLKGRRIFAFAGLWESWQAKDSGDEPLRTCTIITTEPNPLIARFHHRMPVILPPEAHSVWLDPAEKEPGELLPLLVPYPEDGMEAFAVSPKVNNPHNDSPEIIEPAG